MKGQTKMSSNQKLNVDFCFGKWRHLEKQNQPSRNDKNKELVICFGCIQKGFKIHTLSLNI